MLSIRIRTLIVGYYIVLLVTDISDLKAGRKNISRLSSRLSSNRSNRIRKKSSPNNIMTLYIVINNNLEFKVKKKARKKTEELTLMYNLT